MPFAELHDTQEFKDWLVRTLEPLCDADPNVLSDYIIALLKHDADWTDAQWKDYITSELQDFMEAQSRPFVDLLWSTLSSRSFLNTPPVAIAPAAKQASQQTAAAAVAAGGAAGHGPAVVSSYRPPTGPRAQQAQEQQAQGQGQGRQGEQGQQGQAQAGPSRSGRKICYDYHNKGFCLRGATCQYEHGDDSIIPTPEMMMPFGGGQNGSNGKVEPGSNGQHAGMPFSGMDMSQFPFPFPFPMFPFPGMQPGGPGAPGGPGGQRRGGRRAEQEASEEFRGSKNPPHSTERSSTLVITDIPVAHLTVPAIRDYFQQFGEVTNIAIEGKSKRALVSFANNREAYIAWKSDEAVFGSRHVKVLWHRPREGQGAAGQAALEASKGLLENMKRLESGEELQGGKAVHLYGPEQRLRATLKELEEKERRGKKERLMSEQKVLMARAAKTSEREEKLEILKRVKEVIKELEELDKPKSEEEDVEMGGEDDKSKLDKELEKHGMDTKEKRDEAELLKLHSQLAALKDKASSMGIASPGQSRFSPYPQRARGRGRGRGAGASVGRGFGRGGSARKLDNRSRAVIVNGEGLDGAAAEGKLALKEWYEGHGANVIEETAGWKVGFPDRSTAEKVLAMGTKSIPGFTGDLNIAWDASAVPTAASASGSGAGDEVHMDVHMGEEPRRGEREDD